MKYLEALGHVNRQIAETDNTPFSYSGEVSRVVDGDTLDVNVDLGFRTWMNVRVRLIGVDCPETYGTRHDSQEYKDGMAATTFVASLVAEEHNVRVETYRDGQGKWGRWLAHVFIGTKSLNATLISSGHGRPYVA